MKLAVIAMFFLVTACGSGGFNSETQTENRPRKVVTDGDLNVDDGSGVLTADADGAADKAAEEKTKPAGSDMSTLCPGFDKATLDALIASGQPFELECEIEVGQDD